MDFSFHVHDKAMTRIIIFSLLFILSYDLMQFMLFYVFEAVNTNPTRIESVCEKLLDYGNGI